MTAAELSSYVGGDWREGGARLDDVNPAHPDEVVAIVSASGAELAAEAVEAAADAFPSWRATPPPTRGEVLRLAADLLESRATEIGRDLAREEGKTAAEATGETVRAAAILRYYAGQTLEPDGDVYPSASAHTFLYARREPLGVVTAITPWNFPIAIPAWKIAPALGYGNTVVWKPAELVPLTAVHLVSALAEAGLPPGVLNLVLGRSADVGETLVTHDAVAAVSFTGSNEVGRSIQRQAIDAARRCSSSSVARTRHRPSGRRPRSRGRTGRARRISLCRAEMHGDESGRCRGRCVRRLLELLVERALAWKVGDPLDPDTRVGPLASQAQRDRVLDYLDIATGEGARFLAGGDGPPDGSGYYVKPSVLDQVPSESCVIREEIFGRRRASRRGFIRRGSDARQRHTFGLTATLFTRDLGRAFRFANEIRAGVVKVNQESAGSSIRSRSAARRQARAARASKARSPASSSPSGRPSTSMLPRAKTMGTTATFLESVGLPSATSTTSRHPRSGSPMVRTIASRSRAPRALGAWKP
jgi:aldehyde dehydrogenase (NAD+)